MRIDGHKAKDLGLLSLLQPPETSRAPQSCQLKGSPRLNPICSLEPRRLRGRTIPAASPPRHRRVGSRPMELGHPHSPLRPAGSCLSEHPPGRGGLQTAWGQGGRAAAHLPRGRQRAARRGQAPARPTPREEPPCTKAAQCRPHAAKGWHGQLADGARQEWGPTAHFAPGEEGLQQRPSRQAANSLSPSLFFHHKNYLIPYQ